MRCCSWRAAASSRAYLNGRPELLTAARGFAERLLALALEALGKLGEMLDAVLELAHQRDVGVAQAGALDAGRRRRAAAHRPAARRALGPGDRRGPRRRSRDRRAGRDPLSVGDAREVSGQRPLGVAAGRELPAGDGHGEPLAAPVAATLERRGDGLELEVERGGSVLGAGDRVPQVLVAALSGALQTRQAGGLGVRTGLVEDQRVARGERLDLGE